MTRGRHTPLMERVAISDTDGCWVFTGPIDKDGYGRNGKIKAHRESFLVHKGTIPDGLLVRHTCDNRPCVNPDHLLLGTNADNTADMVSRGRVFRGSVNAGENHPMSQLSNAARQEIAAGGTTTEARRALALRFGVSYDAVRGVQRRAVRPR